MGHEKFIQSLGESETITLTFLSLLVMSLSSRCAPPTHTREKGNKTVSGEPICYVWEWGIFHPYVLFQFPPPNPTAVDFTLIASIWSGGSKLGGPRSRLWMRRWTHFPQVLFLQSFLLTSGHMPVNKPRHVYVSWPRLLHSSPVQAPAIVLFCSSAALMLSASTVSCCWWQLMVCQALVSWFDTTGICLGNHLGICFFAIGTIPWWLPVTPQADTELDFWQGWEAFLGVTEYILPSGFMPAALDLVGGVRN